MLLMQSVCVGSGILFVLVHSITHIGAAAALLTFWLSMQYILGGSTVFQLEMCSATIVSVT